MSSQLLFRNEFSSNLADAYGKHFLRYTGRPAKKYIQHFLSIKIIKYIYNITP